MLATIRITTLDIKIDNTTIPTEFQVVLYTFTIAYDGILGKPFITDNSTIINYKTNKLIIKKDIIIQFGIKKCMTIRSENITDNSFIEYCRQTHMR